MFLSVDLTTAGIVIGVALIIMLAARELASVSESRCLRRSVSYLRVLWIPLLIAFAVIAILEILEIVF